MEQGDRASLQFKLLGRFEVWRDGQLLEAKAWPQRKTQTLLKLLLSERGRVFTQDQLIDFLFPDLDLDKAAESLHKRVSELRRVLEPDLKKASESKYILRTGQGYCFSQETPCELDTEEFSKLCKQGGELSQTERWSQALESYQHAIQLYRGPYLAQDAYEEWSLGPRERWREQYLQALGQMGECHARLRQFPQAIESCRRLIQEEPHRESAYRSLMIYQYYAGQPEEALKTYVTCVKALKDELETEPSAETKTLKEDIVTGKVAPLRQAAPNNLPAPTTQFVGREEELAQIAEMLEDPSCRLITIVGPGGMGKTRLALEAGAGHLEKYPDGVYFVALAPVGSPEFIVPTVAQAIQFSFFGQRAPKEQLLDFLKEKQLLLLLDNFEHLIKGAELLGELLHSAPGVKLLVTSRERLKLQAEWAIELQGLGVPSIEMERDLESHSAVQLLLHHVRRVAPRYVPTQQERLHVARICRLVAGMPLAIELAGAWATTLSIQEIADEIERDLSFLSTNAPDLPEKHRSIQALCAHSMALLSPPEQTAFLKLTVFGGGFSRAAAEQLAQAPLHVLSTLMDKSLLKRTPSNRFEIHEFLRQYGEQHLRADDAKHAQANEAHCRFFGRLLLHGEGQLEGGNQRDVARKIVGEIENIRQGWRWAVERGDPALIAPYIGGLFRLYYMLNWFEEGEMLFSRALRSLDEAPAHRRGNVYARLLSRQGVMNFYLRRIEQAKAQLAASLELLREQGDAKEMSFVLNNLGEIARLSGHYEEAIPLYRESIELGQQSQYLYGVGRALNNLAGVHYARGEYSAAKQYFEEAISILEAQGDRYSIGHIYNNLGSVCWALKDYAAAKALFLSCKRHFEEIDDRWGIATANNNLGSVALCLGEHEEANAFYLEALTLSRASKDPRLIPDCLIHLGEIALVRKDETAAKAYLLEALQLSSAAQAMPLVMEALLYLGKLLIQRSKVGFGSELIAHVLQHEATGDIIKVEAKNALEALTPSMSEVQIQKAHEALQAQGLEALEKAIVQALDEP